MPEHSPRRSGSVEPLLAPRYERWCGLLWCLHGWRSCTCAVTPLPNDGFPRAARPKIEVTGDHTVVIGQIELAIIVEADSPSAVVIPIPDNRLPGTTRSKPEVRSNRAVVVG